MWQNTYINVIHWSIENKWWFSHWTSSDWWQKRRRNMAGILTVVETKEILLWHRKMNALYEDDNDVHHCLNSWTNSRSECFKYYGNGAIVNLSIDLGTWMFTKKKNRSIIILTSKRIDYHQRLFISQRWRYSCTCWKTNWI